MDQRLHRRERNATRHDAVVVLGAKPAAPGEPGPAMMRRVAFACAVLKSQDLGALVVSGGLTGPAPSEAAMMKALALGHGIDAARIVVEDHSRNTFENAVFTAREMHARGWTRIVLVTDAWHMPRALYVFRRLGIGVDAMPVPRPPDVSRRTWLLHYLIDLRALMRSAWLFRIGRHKPVVAALLRQ